MDKGEKWDNTAAPTLIEVAINTGFETHWTAMLPVGTLTEAHKNDCHEKVK